MVEAAICDFCDIYGKEVDGAKEQHVVMKELDSGEIVYLDKRITPHRYGPNFYTKTMNEHLEKCHPGIYECYLKKLRKAGLEFKNRYSEADFTDKVIRVHHDFLKRFHNHSFSLRVEEGRYFIIENTEIIDKLIFDLYYMENHINYVDFHDQDEEANKTADELEGLLAESEVEKEHRQNLSLEDLKKHRIRLLQQIFVPFI